MDHITTIIPAFNEEKTIKDIIEVVKKVDLIDDILVVDDGSIDMTATIAKDNNIRVIEFINNRGKGAAVKAGVGSINSDIILLLDADLIGLTPEHITSLILPLISGDYCMSTGLFINGRFNTDFAQKVTPFLTGQRAIRKEIIDKIPGIDITKYGLEISITKYISKNNIPIIEIPLKNLTHRIKEEKMGLIKGFKERMRMYYDITKIMIKN